MFDNSIIFNMIGFEVVIKNKEDVKMGKGHATTTDGILLAYPSRGGGNFIVGGRTTASADFRAVTSGQPGRGIRESRPLPCTSPDFLPGDPEQALK